MFEECETHTNDTPMSSLNTSILLVGIRASEAVGDPVVMEEGDKWLKFGPIVSLYTFDFCGVSVLDELIKSDKDIDNI